MGVETPEFTFEQDAANVQQAVQSDGLRYPVVQDNAYGTWNAYGNEYWPAEYLIDAHGQVRHTQFGEGDYKQSEDAVRSLLREAGATQLPPPMTAKAIMPSAKLATPETYLNVDRAQGFVTPLRAGVNRYPGAGSLMLNEFALRGRWSIGKQSATAAGPGASIEAQGPGSQRLSRADLAGQSAARRSGCCSTDTRSRRPMPARTSTARWSRSRVSGCTHWCRCAVRSSTR